MKCEHWSLLCELDRTFMFYSQIQDEIKQWMESMDTSSLAKSQAKLLVEKADDNKVGAYKNRATSS